MPTDKVKELAEKIVSLGKQIGVELDGPVFRGQIESLLSSALEEAKLDGKREECDWWKNAEPDEYRDKIKAIGLEEGRRIGHVEGLKEATDDSPIIDKFVVTAKQLAYESCAKICWEVFDERPGCHDQVEAYKIGYGAGAQDCAEKIRQKAAEVK